MTPLNTPPEAPKKPSAPSLRPPPGPPGSQMQGWGMYLLPVPHKCQQDQLCKMPKALYFQMFAQMVVGGGVAFQTTSLALLSPPRPCTTSAGHHGC